MHHHSRLGEGEAEKHPHRIKGNQAADAPLKHHQQQRGKAAQGINAVAEHKPIAQGGQLARQEAIPSQESRQTGKIRVGRIGSQ